MQTVEDGLFQSGGAGIGEARQQAGIEAERNDDRLDIEVEVPSDEEGNLVTLDLFFEGESRPKIRFGLGAGDPAWEALADVDWLEPMSEEELALWE